jgi:predicted dehydrogenase
MPAITSIAIGAGERGTNAYAPYALQNPGELNYTAVVEPQKSRREQFAALHGIPPERCFASIEEFWAHPVKADAAIICTSDKEHYAPAKTALEKGYHVLLEKPLSTSAARCLDLKETAEKNNRVLMTCYVLRYTAFYQHLFEILQSGKIGKLISIQQHENIGYAHFSHSYVRGNWHNTAKSCSLILSMACHDLDIFSWFSGSPCKSIQSFGALNYFKKENAPNGATARCTDGCPAAEHCTYYAPALYSRENSGIASSIIAGDLKTGPYGKCVFLNDNDACDNQLVNILFENGVTVSFIINGLSHEFNRNIRIYGTEGEIHGDLARGTLDVFMFKSGTRARIEVSANPGQHSGGDYGIIRDFVRTISGGGLRLTVIQNSLESHIMAFAAEESRKNGRVVEIKDFMGDLKAKGDLSSE